MSSQSGNPISPPPVAGSNANAGGVRRHHTISASSRTARPTSKIAVGELDDPQAEQLWNDDEPVDQDWVGGIGAVGEKSSLHRQASLPTRYHRSKYYTFSLCAFAFHIECDLRPQRACARADHTLQRLVVKGLGSQARTPLVPSTVSPPSLGTKATKKNGNAR